MWTDSIGLISVAAYETVEMVFASCFFAILFGLPLGLFLFISQNEHLFRRPKTHVFLGMMINIVRSVPFIILLVAITPLTRLIVGTSIGTVAAMVPLTLSAIPFFARLVEAACKEVSTGLIEAALAMGASLLQIVRMVLIPEALPAIVRGITLMSITLLGYSAMAGAVGGGGLGNVAIMYGYERFNTSIMLVTVSILIVMVQLFQSVGEYIAKRLAHHG